MRPDLSLSYTYEMSLLAKETVTTSEYSVYLQRDFYTHKNLGGTLLYFF